MAGRKKDASWVYFTEVPAISGKGVKAKCKQCGKQLMGIVARTKKHIDECISIPEKEDNVTEDSSFQSVHIHKTNLENKRKVESDENIENNSTSAKQQKINNFVIKTSNTQKQNLDMQVARYIFATNSSFRTVEHSELKKMISALRPGYTPPNEREIGGELLNVIFNEENEKCSQILTGQIVNMSLDGWSNVHNEPIICISVTLDSGETYLVDTLDTSGHQHTSDYLVKVAKEAIIKCENNYKCLVRSLVTDNAANVKNMREQLQSINLITYGCSAHILNLLAHDFNIRNVKEQIVCIIKYFRNNHFVVAKYKDAGGRKLILPQDVRWNTMADCLSTYLKNWPIIMKVCEENRENIETNVYNKVTNFSLKRNVEDLLNRLSPISLALDNIQKKSCIISTAVHIWKMLEKNLKENNLDKAM